MPMSTVMLRGQNTKSKSKVILRRHINHEFKLGTITDHSEC